MRGPAAAWRRLSIATRFGRAIEAADEDNRAVGATTTTERTATIMKKSNGSTGGKAGGSPSELIDARIEELGDWRGETPCQIPELVQQADPGGVGGRERRGGPG